MNAYNPLESMRRLEGAGLPRQHAEAIASEIGDGTRDLVTSGYLKEQLDAQTDKILVRVGLLVSGVVALACTVMGVIFSGS